MINYPKDGLPHKAVTMHLTSGWLQDFYKKNKIRVKQTHNAEFRTFGRHPLLQSCLASLIPYFDLEQGLPENIASLKMEEAVNIFRSIDESIDGVFGSFEYPGKIDLSDFMEKNYMFNMPLKKFGYLTGSSLTTFKRDFRKAFSKWR